MMTPSLKTFAYRYLTGDVAKIAADAWEDAGYGPSIAQEMRRTNGWMIWEKGKTCHASRVAFCTFLCLTKISTNQNHADEFCFSAFHFNANIKILGTNINGIKMTVFPPPDNQTLLSPLRASIEKLYGNHVVIIESTNQGFVLGFDKINQTALEELRGRKFGALTQQSESFSGYLNWNNIFNKKDTRIVAQIILAGLNDCFNEMRQSILSIIALCAI